MARSYYYFVSSLIMVDFDSPAPMSVEFFLEECERLLTEKDFTLVKRLLVETEQKIETTNAFCKAWLDFDRSFRNEISWFRAEGAGKDPLDFIHGDHYRDPYLMDIIHQASKQDNLLDAEKILDRARWQKLEELSSGQYYNLETILCYGLKLKILQRYQEFNSPKGRAIFDEWKTIKIGS